MKKHCFIISPHFDVYVLLTSELQAPELKGDQAIANLNNVHQSIEVVWGKDETVARAVVAPAAKQ